MSFEICLLDCAFTLFRKLCRSLFYNFCRRLLYIPSLSNVSLVWNRSTSSWLNHHVHMFPARVAAGLRIFRMWSTVFILFHCYGSPRILPASTNLLLTSHGKTPPVPISNWWGIYFPSTSTSTGRSILCNHAFSVKLLIYCIHPTDHW